MSASYKRPYDSRRKKKNTVEGEDASNRDLLLKLGAGLAVVLLVLMGLLVAGFFDGGTGFSATR